MSSIEHIVFDLGGVLLDIDHKLTAAAFDAITGKTGPEGFIKQYSFAGQSTLYTEYEQGLISSEVFRDGIQKELGTKIPQDKFDVAWSTILKTMPKERMDLVERLKKKYKVSLLSNTNEIHVSALDKYFQKTYGVARLSAIFHNTYLSNVLKMRKPNADIYEFVLKDSGVPAPKTLFIDDSKPNVDGAAKLGINTIHLSGISVVDALKDFE